MNVADKRLSLQKAVANNIMGSIVNLEKAQNTKLILVHVIDKNGHQTFRWKKPEEITPQHETHKEIKVGDSVIHEGNTHKILKIHDRHFDLKDSSGKKHSKLFVKVKPADVSDTDNVIQPIQTEEQERALDYEKYGSPAERMEFWSGLVDAFADGECKNLTIAYGSGGVGKTYTVLQNEKLKQDLIDGKAVKFTGGTTAAGFLEMLYDNRDKKIILDDFDMVFKDPQMLSLLTTISRSSEERRITNPTSSQGSDIPPAFEFTGKLMIISNVDLESEAGEGKRNSGRFEELLTNSAKVDLKMSKHETWDLMNEYIIHKDGKVNHNLKFKNSFGEDIESTDKDREDLADFFKANWKETKELSGRTLAKANAIQKYYKGINEDWKDKAKKILLVEDPNQPQPQIEDRFENFNDSVNMVANGLIKSAVVVDKNADRIIDLLKSKGFKNTALNSHGFELQKQMNPNYIPVWDDQKQQLENFATDMYAVITSQTSERALYEALWKHNGKVIIFDKSAKNILSSPLGNGLLKGSLDTSGDGSVAWLSKTNTGRFPVPDKQKEELELDYAARLTAEGFNFEWDETSEQSKIDRKSITHPYDIPKNFNFRGRCIFITDDVNEAQQPIQSRSMIANISTNKEEFLRMAKTIADKREQLGNQFSYITKNTTAKEYREAVKVMTENKDKIHPRKFDEEGIQEIIQMRRRMIKPEMSEEQINKVNRQIGFALNKAETDFIFDEYERVDLMKAFVTLLNK
jgi:hypothetical protein